MGKGTEEAKLWDRQQATLKLNASEDLPGRPQVNTTQH